MLSVPSKDLVLQKGDLLHLVGGSKFVSKASIALGTETAILTLQLFLILTQKPTPQHLQEEIARPSIYAPDLPISFEKIILKCTQKTPDRRYQTIEELLTDIRRSLAHPDEDFVTR